VSDVRDIANDYSGFVVRTDHINGRLFSRPSGIFQKTLPAGSYIGRILVGLTLVFVHEHQRETRLKQRIDCLAQPVRCVVLPRMGDFTSASV